MRFTENRLIDGHSSDPAPPAVAKLTAQGPMMAARWRLSGGGTPVVKARW